MILTLIFTYSSLINPGPPRLWVFLSLLLAILTVRCSGPLPPLPASPATPSLKIALLVPASGEMATFGRAIKNGASIAIDEWNKRGGVLGHHLEAVSYDTSCTFQEGQAAARRAIADGARFIIGPLCSEAAVAVAVEAEPAGIVVIAPTALHPLVTVNPQGQPRATVFSLSYSPEWQGQAAADFAQGILGLNRAVLLYQSGDPYTTALGQSFTSRFINGGGEIVYQATYADSSELTKLATTLQQVETPLVYLPVNAQVASQVIGQLQASQASLSSTTPLLFLGSDIWEGETLERSLAQGSYFPVHFSGQADRFQVQRWVETYRSTFAGEPDTLAALNYDATNILLQAIEQAGIIEPVPVATALEQGTFEAITGPISFKADHTPAKPVPFVQLKDGQLFYVTSILP